MEWTIRECAGGAVVCTGYTADTADEAMDMFLAEHPLYSDDDYYASEANWND